MYEKLREVRNTLNISVSVLKNALGLKTEAAYYKKETGVVKFSLEEAKIISKILNMKIDDIFFENQVSKKET